MATNLQLVSDVLVQLHVHDIYLVRCAYVMAHMKVSHFQAHKPLVNLTAQCSNENDYNTPQSPILQHEKGVCG